MLADRSLYVLINVFANIVTSAFDGDLPTEVSPAGVLTVSDRCSNNTVRHRFVSSRLLLLKKRIVFCLIHEGRKQPKCIWRVYCRLKKPSSSAFTVSEGSNVNPLPSILSFQLTQHLIHICVIFSFNFYFIFWFLPFHQCHNYYVGVFIQFACIMSLICVHVWHTIPSHLMLLSFEAEVSQWRCGDLSCLF